jgi:hypothetical protein
MTAFSGLFDTILPTGATPGHTLLGQNQNGKYKIAARLLKADFRPLRELMLTLNGAAAGETASLSYSRVEHEDPEESPYTLGGTRSIETVVAINRVTTAADKAMIDDILDGTLAYTETNPPVDISGNGGGGRLADKVY